MANTKITSNVIADGAITESKLASGVGGVAGIVSNADATAITIDSSENVGIGTTSPVAVLTSKNTGSLTTDSNDGDHTGFGLFVGKDTIAANTVNTAIGFGSTSTGRKYAAIGMQTYADADQNGLNFYVQTTASGSGASLTEAMRLTNDGNLRVGYTGGGAHVRAILMGNSNTNAGYALVTANTDGVDLLDVRNDGAIYTGGAANSPKNLTIGSAANLVVNTDGYLYKSTSSRRYKNTITDATHGLTELLTLRPVTYKGNSDADGDTVYGGLIAEEVHDAGLTEFVVYNEDDEPDALAYSNMVSLCVKAIQEQQALIEAQATTITDVTTRLETLEST